MVEQTEHVQRLIDIAGSYDILRLRQDIERALAGLSDAERPYVADGLIVALDRFYDSYVRSHA
jgi:hypothetical protein